MSRVKACRLIYHGREVGCQVVLVLSHNKFTRWEYKC